MAGTQFELVQNVYRARPLERLEWLEHGFGTRFFDTPDPIATLRQIHSNVALYADRSGCLGEGDALISDTPGRLIGVRTADCLPILLVDERHRAVAAVHAGWRGTIAQVCLSTLQAMAERWGTLPADMHAAIGPGIGPCCFEVGPEVAVRFGWPCDRANIDLEAVNQTQLAEAGISPSRIYRSGLCTFCHAAQFHSFRRDRERAGRMVAVIGVKS